MKITPRSTKQQIRTDLIYHILNLDIDQIFEFEFENFISFRVYFGKAKKLECPNRKFDFTQTEKGWKVWRKA